MLLRETELWALLVKPSVPEDDGKERGTLITRTGWDRSHRYARPTSERRSLVYRGFPRFAGFSISDLSKSRKPAISCPPSLPRSPYYVAFFFILSSWRRVLLPREIHRHRFKRTLRALLCQRPNRKSQLLRASPFVRALSLSSVSLGVFFNCAQRFPT